MGLAMRKNNTWLRVFLHSGWLLIALSAGAVSAQSGGWRFGASGHRHAMSADAVPPDVTVHRNISYGDDAAQRYDVYVPDGAHDAPVIFMVHGGGWRRGDKGIDNVVHNKLARWAPRGFVFISADYRMSVDPIEQARDVARAVAGAQHRAASWGADPRRFILMGHSAGGHLVALLDAEPSMASDAGAAPWLGSVLLDSGALDVEKIMRQWHFSLYDDAFGKDPAYWRAASPVVQLNHAGAPILAVCSTRRTISCEDADEFTAKAVKLGTRAAVLREDHTHEEINNLLGTDPAYTDAVESFMRGLDAGVAERLEQ